MPIATLTSFPTTDLVQNRPSVKAVIFDMDGTVIHSEAAHAQAMQDILDEVLPSYSQSAEELLRQCYGKADTDVYNAIADIKKHISLEDFLRRKNEKVAEVLVALQRDRVIAPEVETFVRTLFEQKYKLGLVTASEDAATFPVLAALELDHLFDVVLTAGNLPHAKPHPLPYLTALERLDVEASEALIFEDSPTGLEAAQRSGIPYYKVEWYLS